MGAPRGRGDFTASRQIARCCTMSRRLSGCRSGRGWTTCPSGVSVVWALSLLWATADNLCEQSTLHSSPMSSLPPLSALKVIRQRRSARSPLQRARHRPAPTPTAAPTRKLRLTPFNPTPPPLPLPPRSPSPFYRPTAPSPNCVPPPPTSTPSGSTGFLYYAQMATFARARQQSTYRR